MIEVLEVGVVVETSTKILKVDMGTLCNANPAVICFNKMASKFRSLISGRLLSAIAIVVHKIHIFPLAATQIGMYGNIMAYITSC